MKKRIFFALLAAAVLMLAACGKKSVTASSAADTAQISEADAQAVYQSLVGSYQDSFSKRARMDVWQTEGGLGIQVNWASSAFENSEWDLTAVLSADNKLEYADCAEYHQIYSDAGECKSEQVSSNQKGYFSIEDGKLLWNGAADEGCRECVFERVPEEG